MTTGSEFFLQAEAGDAGSGSVSQTRAKPGDVLHNPNMSVEEKRALLASWASDARTIPGVPTLRQLDDGSILRVDEILHALQALDEKGQSRPGTRWRRSYDRRHQRKGFRLTGSRRPDDDDDPPPCPAYAAIYPRRGSGGTVACPEPALA